MITLRTYLRTTRANKKGESKIYFIVGDQWISTGIQILPIFWDQENGIITKKHPAYYTINPTFQILKSRAEQCISNINTNVGNFNRKYFEQYVFEGSEVAENPSFAKLVDEYCNVNDLSWSRVKHYRELKNDLAAVAKNVRLHDINYNFAVRLKKYLQTKETPNNENTITRKLKQLKAVIHYCQKSGYLKMDPLAFVKLKEIRGTKQFLTADELSIIEDLHKSNTLSGSQQATLTYFLFSCYTGLRYSDIVKLTYQDIKDNMVMTTQEKTNKPVAVPLIEKASNLISKCTIGRCFRTFTNQATNRFLKDIIEAAGINKKITFHCSRHTFGTLSIYWGIPVEVVAELMGIDLKTVYVYAKFVDEVKKREMQKWGKLAV